MIDIDKVIILENKEEYLVVDKVMHDDVMYYYIAKVNETRTDIDNNYKLITIVNRNGNDIIEEVTGKDKLKEILPLFGNQLQKN